MAAPQCMSNDGKPAVFVGTFMQSGDAVALCEDCLPAFTGSVTADMFGVDGNELLAWLKEHGGAETAGTPETAAELAAPPAILPGKEAVAQERAAAADIVAGGSEDPTQAGAGEPDAEADSPGAPAAADGDSVEHGPPDGEQTEATATG